MNITFNLKNPGAESSPVRLVVTHMGKVYRRGVGITLKTSQWTGGRRGQWTTNREAAARLKDIRLLLETRLDAYSTEEEIREAMDAALAEGKEDAEGGENARPTFWEYFDEWSNRDCPAKRQRRNTCSLIGSLMGRGADWEDVDTAYYFNLVRKMNAHGYSVNYRGSVISKLRTVMSEGYRLKYHRNEDFRQFRKTTEQPDTVYLTEAELDRLWAVELDDPMERQARDLFLIGCYTAARFSDYSRLAPENVSGGLITFSQRKTADTVVMPLSGKVRELLRRNGGRSPRMNQTVFNREIKKVCMKAGIGGRVQVTRSRGERHVTTWEPKWKMVSSHTARRTGATLLYMSGVPAAQCMMITGHRTEAAFMRYIRVTKEENARSLADNPFFR